MSRAPEESAAETPAPLTTKDVAAALAPYGLQERITHFEQTTYSSEDAARAIGCSVGQIAKSICLTVDGAPVLVVASGDVTVFDRKIADIYGVGRKKVRTAGAEQCVQLFGYAPGGVPPVGLRSPDIPVLIDERLKRWDQIHAAAGTPHDNFSVSFEELVRISGGSVVDCAKQ